MGIFNFNSGAREKVENSPVTSILKRWVNKEFTDTEGQTLDYLRRGYFASFDVRSDGVVLRIGKYPEPDFAYQGIYRFSDIGYGDLPDKKMAPILKQILIDEAIKSPYVKLANKYGAIGFDKSNLSTW